MANLNFHQTFKPEPGYLYRILELCPCEKLSLEEISKRTGIPTGKSSGKVEPMIDYALFMGLINMEKEDRSYTLSRTKLGEAVFQEDPGFQEKITLLLMHGLASRYVQGAPGWGYVFRSIFPKYSFRCHREDVLKEMSFFYGKQVTSKTIGSLFAAYSSMFAPLSFFSETTAGLRLSPLPLTEESLYAYAYLLFSYWDEEKSLSSLDEITSVDFKSLSFGATFGWNEKNTYECLERLSEKRLIRLNRQFMPFTILRFAKKDDLVPLLYSELL